MGFRATAGLPYERLERATAGLRGRLRLLAADDGVMPDWSTLQVTGPTMSLDARGRTWAAAADQTVRGWAA